MTIDLIERPRSSETPKALFAFSEQQPVTRRAEATAIAVPEVELVPAETSDFDMATIATVAGIVIFKLSMLGLLLVSL